jgi:KaiC/GvpD/RAD55 family RecA-like ATPase
MMQNSDLIAGELQQAGASADSFSPLLLRLDGYRITTESDLSEEAFLMSIKGKPCFPRRDLSAVTGQAKSGKTVLVSLLMASAASAEQQELLPGIKRLGTEPLKVMWVDTEQSPQSTLQILKGRVAKMIGGDFPQELFYVFNIRSVYMDDRYDLMAEGVATYHPDIVIIDNIRDMIRDINDGPKAQELIEKLMQLAQEQNCNVVCVLHLNRSAENRGLRGWLGTELMNKVFEVFTCQKLIQKEGVKPTFSVEQTLTRKYDIDSPLYYQINDEGIPVAANMKGVMLRNAQGQFTTKQAGMEKLNQNYILTQADPSSGKPLEWDLQKLFTDAMAGWQMRTTDDLERRVMELTHIRQKQYYYKVLDEAVSRGIVQRQFNRVGRVVITLPPGS